MIEMLVVVSIIALLAALIAASVSRAKSSAYSIGCRSNLRQIAIALAVYVGDNDSYPLFATPGQRPLSATSVQDRGKFWYDDLSPLSGSRWTSGIFLCPDFRGANHVGAAFATGIAYPDGSYFYNAFPFQPSPSLGLGGDRVGDGPIRPCHEASVVAPSQMIATGDALLQQLKVSPSDLYSYQGRGFSWIDLGLAIASPARGLDWLSSINGDDMRGVASARRRHNGRFHVSFCDGHAEPFPMRKLFSMGATVTPLWASDNQPHTVVR